MTVELTEEQLDQVRGLCMHFSVDWLAVFGSAATCSMKPESDIDFVVRF